MKRRLSILYLICYFTSFLGITEASSVDHDKNKDLLDIRLAIQINEKRLSLIKMNYVVQYEGNIKKEDVRFGGRKAQTSKPYSYCSGVWAQDDVRQHSSRDYYVGSNTLSRSEITIVNGELMKWAKRPEFMQGAINKIENYNWQNRLTNRLGIRPFEGEQLLSEILIPENASILKKGEVLNGQSTYLVEVKRPIEPVYYARIWIDKEKGLPLRYVYYMKSDSIQEDVLSELLVTKTHTLSNSGVLPVETKRTLYKTDNIRHTFSTVDVNSITIKREDIPDSLFDIKFPEGAEIFDGIAGITINGPGMLDVILEESIQQLNNKIMDNNDNVTSNLTSEFQGNSDVDSNISALTPKSNSLSSINSTTTPQHYKYSLILVLLAIASVICLVILWVLFVKLRSYPKGDTTL